MPIYEYTCESCDHDFEKLVRIGAPPPPCPECEGSVRKRVSASGFILKGSGWYRDHYGLKSGGGSSGESGKSGSKKADGAKSGGDSSAAPKPSGSTPTP